MAVQHKSLGGRGASMHQLWELLEGKIAAAGGVICISSLPLDSQTLDPSLGLPAIVPPSRHPSSLSQPHSLISLFSYYTQVAPLPVDQHYFSQFTLPEAAAAIMPGPLRERDPNAHASRRSSVQFLDNFRPKSYLSHQRLPEHDVVSTDESDENTAPHFMTSTTASASRSITPPAQAPAHPKPRRTPTPHSLLTLAAFGSKQPGNEHVGEVATSVNDTNDTLATSSERLSQVACSDPVVEKPLPSRPVAHVVSTNPYNEGRTLIDASERPLRRSPGTPNEEDWPALSPAQSETPNTLRISFHSPAPTRIPMDPAPNRTPASPGKQRPTIKMVAQKSSESILPCSSQTEKISASSLSRSFNPGPAPSAGRPPSPPNPTSNSDGHTTTSSLPQPKPRLVDIPSPKSRQGRRPPVTNSGAIPRPRGVTRPSGAVQAKSTRQKLHHPHSDHPRGYPRMEISKSTSPEPRSGTSGMGPPRTTVDHQENVQRKKSAIPVPARTTSPQLIPSGPAVFTLKAKVSTPSSLGGKSLSTIESADTGRIELDMETNTVMRPGPQRRPTLSRTFREFKHLSADTDADPTTISAQTETTVSRPSSRTESLLWVETEDSEGIRTKRLSSGGSGGLMSDYGPTLTISPDADELIMGRKSTPSPPVPPVNTASARSSGHKSRDLHRRAVTNEHPPVKAPHRQDSADSIQAEDFTVKPAIQQEHCSFDSLPRLYPRHNCASQGADGNADDKERLAAVTQTLAMLEGGHRNGAGNPQFKQDAALARAYMDKPQKSPSSAHSSDVFASSQAHRSSGGLVRSDSGHSTSSSKRATSLSRGAMNMKRSSSVVSIASSRPPVPAKDYMAASKAPSKNPSIEKRSSVGQVGTTSLRSPYGLSNGYSATPSNIPQPSNGCGSSARLSSRQAMTDTSRSVSGEKRSMSKAKLTMSGFRGFFHKRNDNKILNKAGDRKKRSNTKVTSTGSPMTERSGHRVTKTSSCRRSPGRAGTLTKACHKHPAEFVAASPPPETTQNSDITQTTALAMHITTMAREQEDGSKKHQLLSVATAMLGAIDSAKHAKIAAEHAAQAAREASMHQEMTRQSLIAINKILTNSPGIMGTLSRSRTSLRQRSSRPSTVVQ